MKNVRAIAKSTSGPRKYGSRYIPNRVGPRIARQRPGSGDSTTPNRGGDGGSGGGGAYSYYDDEGAGTYEEGAGGIPSLDLESMGRGGYGSPRPPDNRDDLQSPFPEMNGTVKTVLIGTGAAVAAGGLGYYVARGRKPKHNPFPWTTVIIGASVVGASVVGGLYALARSREAKAKLDRLDALKEARLTGDTKTAEAIEAEIKSEEDEENLSEWERAALDAFKGAQNFTGAPMRALIKAVVP